MRFVIGLLATCVLAAGAARADVQPAPGHWYTITIPVSAERLCDAVDLPAPALPESLLFNVVRVLHERPHRRDDFERGRARAALELLRDAPVSAAPGSDPPTTVPLPLAPETWANVILKRRVSPQALAGAILADRRAALLYVGLSQLDASTLLAIERMPGMLWSLDEKQASALAAFGGSLAIDEGGVRLPGPPELAPAWAALAGAPASDPARFVPALLEHDRGRLAYLFDSLARLDAAHRRFALAEADGLTDPHGTLAALYEVFRRVSPEWDAALHPFYRPPLDPARLLATLQVTDEGRLVPAWSRTVWERAFSGQVSGANGSAPPPGSPNGGVDAAWLLAAVLAPGPKAAPARAAQVRFAQRLSAGPDERLEPAVLSAIAGYARFPALMLALESMAVTRPALYADAGRVAEALTRRSSATALAVFQASLAVIARGAWAGSLDQPDAERLAEALIALDAQAEDYEEQVAGWLTAVLMPALAEATGAEGALDRDTIVLRALAGMRAPARAASPPLLDWYGRRYAVDAAAGAFGRVSAIRERQGPPTLDEALAIGAAIDALDETDAREAAGRALVARLQTLIAALPDIDQNRELRLPLERAHARLGPALAAAGGRPLAVEVRRDLARARGAALADALTALTYAPALGDPSGPARLGGHVARRHQFVPLPDLTGDGADPAWRAPRETVSDAGGWHVEGALLGLEQALARLTLRRLDVDVIPMAPRIDATTRRLFALDTALTRASDFSDADRDLVAAGLEAGRARVARIADDPDALGAIATELGLEARRVQAIAWARAEAVPDPGCRFSWSELLRLGAARPLPFSVVTVPGEACPREAPACPREATDLALRLAEGLAARGLPAALLPGLLGPATQDFLDQVQPAYAGDLEALWQYVAGLPRQRVDDYVAALEGSALRPVSGSGGERD